MRTEVIADYETRVSVRRETWEDEVLERAPLKQRSVIKRELQLGGRCTCDRDHVITNATMHNPQRFLVCNCMR